MSALPNYNRMPGPGDLPGDSKNPNSPDYVEPVFAEWEAMECVESRMKAADRAEILGDLADAAGLLEVLKLAPGLSWSQLARLNILATHAKELADERDREYRILNGDSHG